MELARAQDGFFSASQAAAEGIDRRALYDLVARGLLERDDRGLFHLVPFPASERAELWRAVLWPSVQRSDNRTVLSDGTALSLYDISTINPSTIDITVPRSVRLRRDIPPTIRIHRRDYDPEDVTTVNGLPTTTLYRTLVDLITDAREHQFVDEALRNADGRGLLTSREIRGLTALRELSDLDARLFRRFQE